MSSPMMNPLVLLKVVLWIVTIVTATVWLHRRKVTRKIRLASLVVGVLLFGVAFGIATPWGNPNPVLPVRAFLTTLIVRRRFILTAFAMPLVYLAMVFVSNKSICGWGCQLGLLQDLLYRVPAPKWKPSFWLSNSVRIIAFIALVVGLAVAGVDWIRGVDPFRIFSFRITLGIGLFAGAVLVLSMFIYRPWCQFLCPFGLLGWVVEQVSLLRPRINREACKGCKLCVNACPTQAMADFFDGKRFHADCFACGACIAACPVEDALGWRAPRKRQ